MKNTITYLHILRIFFIKVCIYLLNVVKMIDTIYNMYKGIDKLFS